MNALARNVFVAGSLALCATVRADDWLVALGSCGCIRTDPDWYVLDDEFHVRRWIAPERVPVAIDEACIRAESRAPEEVCNLEIDSAKRWVYFTRLDASFRTSSVFRAALDGSRMELLSECGNEQHLALSSDGRRELVVRRDLARGCRAELVIRDLDARRERVISLCADITQWPPAYVLDDLGPAFSTRVGIRRGAWSSDESIAALIVGRNSGISSKQILLRVNLATGAVRECALDPTRCPGTVRAIK